MARSTLPFLLWRVTTSHTAGASSDNPGALIPTSTDIPSTIQALATLLHAALLGRNLPDNNPFVFFTSSLLYALVYAAFRAARGKTDVTITVFDPRQTATSPNGTRQVQFHRVVDLMDEWGVVINNKRDGSRRTYESEWVALGTVYLDSKGGACCVQWERLLAAGLYDFYPALGEVQKASRKGPKLYVALSMLRGFGFGVEKEAVGLSEEKIELADKLVSLFGESGAHRGGAEEERTKGRVRVWFLSLVKRKRLDEVLVGWVRGLSVPVVKTKPNERKKEVVVIDDDGDDDRKDCIPNANGHLGRDIIVMDDSDDDSDDDYTDADIQSDSIDPNPDNVPEEQQFALLRSTLCTHNLSFSTLLRPKAIEGTINPKTVAAEIQDWNAWLAKNREERCAARAERPSRMIDTRPRRREARRPRYHGSRDMTRERDGGRGNRAPRPLAGGGASRTAGERVERRPRRR
ncbi:hypothetical protein BDY17DRAFT_36531 [Neohortaea acidophila]|uniref:Uncharacterized protein n=1 Tax=Neohortaea acidophila TaxID=245834 RepID=A0A6A6PJ84_9PEZI|nr:uncharacterized protein BDY17DRAFT_36531 [Neohortaea acidophila]KAF2479327.1 hypothetical protein BDY17DRAFT_36531 [Neohortaea acidophila]